MKANVEAPLHVVDGQLADPRAGGIDEPQEPGRVMARHGRVHHIPPRPRRIRRPMAAAATRIESRVVAVTVYRGWARVEREAALPDRGIDGILRRDVVGADGARPRLMERAAVGRAEAGDRRAP